MKPERKVGGLASAILSLPASGGNLRIAQRACYVKCYFLPPPTFTAYCPILAILGFLLCEAFILAAHGIGLPSGIPKAR